MAKESPVSKWVRPALIGWAAFMAFGIALIAGVLELFQEDLGMRFGRAVMETLGLVPGWVGDVLQTFFGFYAIGKSGEKMVKHYRAPDMTEPESEFPQDKETNNERD